ncbi:MAG: MDR family MFS transporter [Anaerolineae bacterium]
MIIFRARAGFDLIVRGFPQPFPLLFAGELVASSGRFLVYPFFAIYLHDVIGASLSMVGTLLAISSVPGLLAQGVAGPLVDRFGRRRVLLISLALDIAVLLSFASVRTLEAVALLMVAWGFVGGVPHVSINAMVADIVSPEKRQEAYGLLRVATNVGAAVGPALGGYVVAVSYPLGFTIAAAAAAVYLVIFFLWVGETKPEIPAKTVQAGRAGRGGYGPILRDTRFLSFGVGAVLVGLAYAIPWVFLSVYLKDSFGIPENRFGFLVTLNGLMVVFFQFPIARWLARYPKMPVMAVGAALTGLGAGTVAYFDTYALFVISMVIITLGELVSVPTASAFVADAAPPDMRGRYMAAFGLTWGLSFGIGPIAGGTLGDLFGPAAIWFGALAAGLAATLVYLGLSMARVEARAPAEAA